MGLLDIFRRSEDNSPAKEDLSKASGHFDKGEFEDALRALTWGFMKDVNYKPLYKVAADSLEALGATEEKKLFEAVYRDQKDRSAYIRLGDFYQRVEHYGLGRVFYEKALELYPNNTEVPGQLAICYARRFEVGKALEILTRAKSNDFWDMYFLNKLKILNKRTDGVERSLEDLQKFLGSLPDGEGVDIGKLKVTELQETLQRYNTVRDIRTHIRDWQFIQYGGVILDYFEDDDVGGGRYVGSWGSNESIKMLAVKLKEFLSRMSVPVRAVFALDDRNSEIVGRVVAKELGLEFDFYDPSRAGKGSLVVSSDSLGFRGHKEFWRGDNDQLLFAANHNWLCAASVTPDIIGFMSQFYSFPWDGGGLRVNNPGDGNVESIPPDDRPADEIATEIFNLENKGADLGGDLDFYLEHRDHLKGIGKLAGKDRCNFVVESPVPGSYFGN